MIKNAFSIEEDIKEAVDDVKSKIGDIESNLVIFFASSHYDPHDAAFLMRDAFVNADVIGCTTAGELTSGHVLDNSLVAMAFDEDAIEDVKVEVVRNIDSETNIPQAFGEFENYYDKSMMELEYDEYVGVILVDGLRAAEERLMEKIGEQTMIRFIGGSAGDDLKFEQTHVFINGKTLTNAAILALVKPACEFDILKTQSFEPMEKRFIVTKADERNREVIEFDHERAAYAYANALERTIDEVPDSFMSHPVGVMVGDEPYVRSPQMVSGGNVRFYCRIMEGMEVALLKSRNILEDTKRDLDEKIQKFGNAQGIINFNCILRTLELKQKHQTEEYGKIFKDIPTIGFSTYGEEYIGHINQTATMLLFKDGKKAA